MKKTSDFFRVFSIWLVIGWFSVFILLPILLIFIASFLTRSEVKFIELSFTLESYYRFFSPIYFTVFLKTFLLAIYVTLLCLLMGYPFAYILSRFKGKTKTLFFILTIIPFWTSSLIRTYAMMVILRTNGLINNVLLALGVINQPVELLYNNIAIIIGFTYSLLPFMILPLYAGFEKLNNSYLEAAKDLGANNINLFFRILVPLTMPSITAGCILVFLSVLGIFYISDILGGSKDLLIGNLIRNQFLISRDWPFGAAISVLLTLFMTMLMAIYYKSAKKSFDTGIVG